MTVALRWSLFRGIINSAQHQTMSDGTAADMAPSKGHSLITNIWIGVKSESRELIVCYMQLNHYAYGAASYNMHLPFCLSHKKNSLLQ